MLGADITSVLSGNIGPRRYADLEDAQVFFGGAFLAADLASFFGAALAFFLSLP